MPPLVPNLYGFAGSAGGVSGRTDSELSSILEAIAPLLSSLELAPAPTAPQPPARIPVHRRILGTLGDALMAAAAVRAGGAPPSMGPFRATTLQRQEEALRTQQEYEKRLAENAAADRTLRNQVRVTSFEERQRRERELAVAKARGENRALRFVPSTIDVGGVPTRVVDVYDPATGEHLGRSTTGEAGYAPFIQPAIPGVSPPTRIPRAGPAGPVSGVTPPPPPGTAKDITGSLNMRVLYNDAVTSFENYVAQTGRMKRTITSVGRRLPGVGSVLEETALSFSDPEGVDVARKIDNLADILLRLRSGAQINESEFQRLRSLLPKLGENPVTAMANFRRFETELLTTLRVARERAPGLLTPDLLQSLGLSEADLGGPANRPGGTPGQVPSVDEILRKYDEEYGGAEPTP